jgi:hypothetical protein
MGGKGKTGATNIRMSAPGYLYSLGSFLGTTLDLKPTVLLHNVNSKASANICPPFLRPIELRNS